MAVSILEKATQLEQEGKLRLVEVDGTNFGAAVQRFHYSPIPHTPAEIDAALAAGDESLLAPKSIWFNGNEFAYWPFNVEGLEMTGETAAAPTLSVSNLDSRVTALCINYDDMAQAVVRIIDTYVDYIDARNFAGGNPDADPLQTFTHTWWIDAKSAESDDIVTFTLGSPADLEGQLLPTRQLIQICEWARRGEYRANKGCSYNGTAYFDERGNPTNDPAKDQCGGCMSDCQLRFGHGLADPKEAVLDFGGMPGGNLNGQ